MVNTTLRGQINEKSGPMPHILAGIPKGGTRSCADLALSRVGADDHAFVGYRWAGFAGATLAPANRLLA